MKKLYKRKSRILAKKLRESHFGFDPSVSNFELAWLNFWIAFIESGGLRYVFRVWLFLFVCTLIPIKNSHEFIIWGSVLVLLWTAWIIGKFIIKRNGRSN